MTEVSRAASSPREIWDRLRRRLEQNDKEGFAALLAVDGVVEWPFSPTGAPVRIVGREQMLAFARASALANRLEYQEVLSVVHETGDPEVIVVEMEVRGRDTETDRRFKLWSVAVIRVSNGEIVSYRDYINPLAAAQITGRLPELFAALNSADGGSRVS